MRKKILTLVFALIMTTAMIVPVAGAESTATFTVASLAGNIGEEIEVPVTIKNNPGILSALLTVKYDDGLTLLGVTAGDAFEGFNMTVSGSLSSPCRILMDSLELNAEDIKDGEFVVLNFRINDDAEADKRYNIDISVNDAKKDAGNNTFESVLTSVENGIVRAIDFIPGDIDKNGEVNLVDIICLRRYLVGSYDVSSYNLSAANIDGDEDITLSDVILMRRYAAGGYGVELKLSDLICNHTMTGFSKTEPTCTQEGNIEYWYCSGCKSYFADADGFDEIQKEETVLPIKEHDIVIDQAVAPTYSKTGLTEGQHCSLCNKVIVAQQTIPVLGSGYALVYDVFEENAKKVVIYALTPEGEHIELIAENSVNLEYYRYYSNGNYLLIKNECSYNNSWDMSDFANAITPHSYYYYEPYVISYKLKKGSENQVDTVHLAEEGIAELENNGVRPPTRFGMWYSDKYINYDAETSKIGSYIIDDSTLIYYTPSYSGSYDTNYFRVLNKSDLNKMSYFNSVYVYEVDKFGVAKVVYLTSPINRSIDLSSSIAVVSDIAKDENDDGDLIYKIEMIQNGEKITAETKDTDVIDDYGDYYLNSAVGYSYYSHVVGYGFYPGAVIMYNEDFDGKINYISKIYPTTSNNDTEGEEAEVPYYLTDYFTSWQGYNYPYGNSDNCECFIVYGKVTEKDTANGLIQVETKENTAEGYELYAVKQASYSDANITVVEYGDSPFGILSRVYDAETVKNSMTKWESYNKVILEGEKGKKVTYVPVGYTNYETEVMVTDEQSVLYEMRFEDAVMVTEGEDIVIYTKDAYEFKTYDDAEDVRIGTAEDIKKGDYVLFRSNGGITQDIVIFRNFNVSNSRFWL